MQLKNRDRQVEAYENGNEWLRELVNNLIKILSEDKKQWYKKT